jgi:hypothetical protein
MEVTSFLRLLGKTLGITSLTRNEEGRLLGRVVDLEGLPPHAGCMQTTTIVPGMTVIVVDAEGVEHQVEALSGVETGGHNFPVVWVARPLAAGGTDRVPWPAEAVRPAEVSASEGNETD